jgi:O-antigen/teichoic acid export membrane protein
VQSYGRLFATRSSVISAIKTRLIAGSRAFWSGTDAVAGSVGALFMTAGLIRTLGKQDYGLLVVVLAVSTLSMAINPAIVATTTKYVSEVIGSRKLTGRGVARIVTASLTAVVAIGAVCILIAWIFSSPITRALFGETVVRERPDVGEVLLLAVVAVAIQQIDGVLAGAIRGLERFRAQGLAELASRFLLVSTVVCTGWLTHDLLEVLAVNCAMLAVSVVGRALLFRSLAPGRLVFAKPRRSELRLVRDFGIWMWLSAAASVAYMTLDRVVIARLLGPAAAAEFQVYAQLTQLIHYVPASLLAFAFPAFSRLSAKGEEEKGAIRRLYRKLLFACAGGGGAIATVLLAFRGTLLHVLAGRTFHASDIGAFVYLVCGFALLAVGIAPYYLLLGMGRSRAVSLITSISMAIAVALMPLLIARYGLDGAALARLIYPLGALLLLHKARATIGTS